jgi:ubiquinone/menaquinone biosynthesis C-methylase UbiE
MEQRGAKPWWQLVRFGFRLLYNEFAFTYDTVSKVVSLGAWRCWQRAALKHLHVQPGASVLELAYGTGDLQLDLHALGYRVYGHDLSPHMARIASRKVRQNGHTPRLSRGIAQALPYPSDTFAAVISTFPTDFILKPETLREVHRVLDPGGRFVIVPSGAFTTSGAAESGLEVLYRATGQRQDDALTDGLPGYFAQFGYRVTIAQEPCPRSVATVIVAET